MTKELIAGEIPEITPEESLKNEEIEKIKVWMREKQKPGTETKFDSQTAFQKIQLFQLVETARKAFRKDSGENGLNGHSYSYEKLEIIEMERNATPQHLQNEKMFEVCNQFTQENLINLLGNIKTTCPTCGDMSGGKAFVNYVAQFIERFINFNSAQVNDLAQVGVFPKNVEYLFHLNIDDIFTDPFGDTPKLKEQEDFDLRECLKEMSMLDINNILTRIDACKNANMKIMKHDHSCQKQPAAMPARNALEISYLVTCIRKEFGMEEDAMDMVTLGERYSKTDVPKALEYLKRGYKCGLEMHKNGEKLRDRSIPKNVLMWLKFRIIRDFLSATEAYQECKELFYLVTEGQFKGLHLENGKRLADYCNLIEMLANKSLLMDDSSDPLYTIDIYTQGMRKLEKFINIKNKNVNFDKLMAVKRYEKMNILWHYHKWGQYGENWKEVPELEKPSSVEVGRQNANIIVNMNIETHYMNRRKQFVVESLDKALRIAKDKDIIFLNKGRYESSNKNKNGKTCYEINKNLTLIGVSVPDVNILSSFVKFNNTTVTIKRLTICASEHMKNPLGVYMPHDKVESSYILEGVVHFENVKFPIDKNTAVFVVHSEGKARPVVSFKYCTVSNLIKDLGQDMRKVMVGNEEQLQYGFMNSQQRRLVSFCGEAPKITLDTCWVKEISNVISVLDTDVAPKKRKNEAGEEVEVPNCAEITIRDCQFSDCLSVFTHEKKPNVASGMKLTFRRNLVQCQTADYESWHEHEFKKVRSTVLHGMNDYISFSFHECKIIDICHAKEIIIKGNLMEARTYGIQMITVGTAEKFNFESNYASNEGWWEALSDEITICIYLANVKESFIRNSQISGFTRGVKIDVKEDEYNYIGILDSDIEYCKEAIIVGTIKHLDTGGLSFNDQQRMIKNNSQKTNKERAKVTISNIDFNIIVNCISIPNDACSIDISDCTFSKSCAAPIIMNPEIAKKDNARVDNTHYAHDDEDNVWNIGFLQGIPENPTIVDSKSDKYLPSSRPITNKDKINSTLVFLYYMIMARRDKYQVTLKKLMHYNCTETICIKDLKIDGGDNMHVMSKQDELCINGKKNVFDGNIDDEVD